MYYVYSLIVFKDVEGTMHTPGLLPRTAGEKNWNCMSLPVGTGQLRLSQA